MIERQQEPGLPMRTELGRHEVLAGNDINLHLMVEVDGEWQDAGDPLAGVVTHSRVTPEDGEEAGFLFMPSEPLPVDDLYPTICPRFIPFGSFKKEFEDGTVVRLRFAVYRQV